MRWAKVVPFFVFPCRCYHPGYETNALPGTGSRLAARSLPLAPRGNLRHPYTVIVACCALGMPLPSIIASRTPGLPAAITAREGLPCFHAERPFLGSAFGQPSWPYTYAGW